MLVRSRRALAGLILFLYAVSSLSTHLNEALGDRARAIIARYTSHTLGSILVGIITTAILDSSSAVIIMAIVMVNAQVMTFRQAMGIVLGANIGTTVSSQIIALDVARYSPLFLAAGFVLMVASRSDHVSRAGRVLLYFGDCSSVCSPWSMPSNRCATSRSSPSGCRRPNIRCAGP
ncbi:MAG: hypothetical protein FJW29_06655 [Acidobacteria bacterium]|nr:hypothetical protein [Acidobacteriota bacterium]